MSKGISETAFASQVEALLDIGHWRWMHPRPARVRRHGQDIYETAYSGHKGWLDYLALRPPRILVFELKNDKAKMTPEQVMWFELWKMVLNEVYLWRPSQIEEIVECLR